MGNQNFSEEKKEPIRAYISEIEFNNGQKLVVNENDIVLLVGPNNSGKSQSLNDIYARSGESNPTVVINNIRVKKSDGSLFSFIKSVSEIKDIGNQIQFPINGNIYAFDKNSGDVSFNNQEYYGNYRDLFLVRLTTETRLRICNPAGLIDRDKAWSNPIHKAAYDTECGKWLSQNYYKAFGNHITPNTLHGSTIPLCIGAEVKLKDEYENEQERQNAYADILESYKTVNTQGDGVKSFTGILLYLMLKHYSTYLIDEPESFLHPPQARIMGQIIGETLRDNQQAFISTHSEEIVKGLLDVCEDRLKIVRITREGDTNSFSILENQKVQEVFGDPLLKYSNIMSSLFHKKVVLCESDSDCKMYSVIENHLKQKAGKYSETLFIHCGGKQRMARTAAALKALEIDVRLIPDLDVLNDENTIKEIATVFGIEWDSIRGDYKTIEANLHSNKEKINRVSAKMTLESIINNSNDTELSAKEIKQIQEAVKIESKWSGLKKFGKNAIPAGNATNSFEIIDSVFRSHNIYLVPVGELECFVKSVGNHGPEWVNNVLEQYQDLDDPVYEEIRKFIQGIGL